MKKFRVFLSLALSLSIAFSMQPAFLAHAQEQSAAAQKEIVVSGKVAEVIEKYGNINIDLSAKDFLKTGIEIGDIVTFEINGEKLDAPVCTSYSDVTNGSVLLSVPRENEDELVIVAINMGNFASTYNVKKGDAYTIRMKEKAGYLDEYTIRQLERTYERSDYASDEVYANFRMVTAGNIAEGILYRSSSPVNNEISRAEYADALIKKAGVAAAINLADTKEELEGYLADSSYATPYYQSLYEDGKVVYLAMGLDFTEKAFEEKMKTGLTFMIENEGPYVVHCTEGKDRAGFTMALLEALMGATKEEIKADYTQSYVNYYHVEKDSELYDKIAEGNIYESLRQLAGLETGASLEGVDLVKAAESYLSKIGLTAKQIDSLKKRLSTAPVPKEDKADDDVVINDVTVNDAVVEHSLMS